MMIMDSPYQMLQLSIAMILYETS